MKNLIIYFSIFGSMKRFAEMIHKKVGGDISETKPVTPYETGYKELMKFPSSEEIFNAVTYKNKEMIIIPKARQFKIYDLYPFVDEALNPSFLSLIRIYKRCGG